MNVKTGNSTMVLGLALALGVLGDLLFRDADWGINVAIWMAALFGAVAAVRGAGTSSQLSGYVWVAVALSVLAVFRDAVILRIITMLALLASVAFATIPASRAERLQQTVYTFLVRVGDTVIGGARVFTHYMPSIIPKTGVNLPVPSSGIVRVLRSVALSGAALLFFGSLLVSADAMFERVVFDLFHFEFETILSHAVIALFFAWLGCWLLLMLTAGPDAVLPGHPGDWRAPGYALEINSMLATINGLFIAFLIVQAGYFFGGEAQVLDEEGPTFAEYARRGFFELAAVAVFAFLTVLVCDALVPLAGKTGRLLFNGLTSMHVALVIALVASALDRLRLYIEAYGLTELRFYVATATLWIPLAFAMLAYAVLLSTRAALPRLLVNSLFIAVFVMHAINPAGIVARTNITRENAQERFDVEYAVSMGADAVPNLVKRLSLLSAAQQDQIEAELNARWGDRGMEIRDWNYSRWTAMRAVRGLSD